MKINRLFAVLLSAVLILGLTFPVVATEPEETAAQELPLIPGGAAFTDGDTVTFGCHTPDARYPIHENVEVLDYSDAAILYEITSDTLVYAHNADKQFYPSSLVKIMTALLAIENGDLSATIAADYETLRSVPSSALKAGLDTGEELTLEELLYCMIVGSANDAAAVIAAHIGGTQENFVAMMNRRAAELGCTGTNFTNPTGLHDDTQVTTARDMVKLLRAALDYPVFTEMFGTTNYRLGATNLAEERSFWTSNYMILPSSSNSNYYDERVTGGRTGVTDDGRRCLAVTAEDDGAQYISVVLNAKPEYAADGTVDKHGSFEDTLSLLELAFDGSKLVQVFYDGAILGQVSVANGANDAALGTDKAVFCVLPADFNPNLLTTRKSLAQSVLTAPVEAGTYAAEYQVWFNGICIASASLYTKNSVAEARQPAQQTPVDQEPGFDAGALSTAFMILGVIFLILVVLAAGLFLARFVRGAMRNARLRQRRQDRRRSK